MKVYIASGSIDYEGDWNLGALADLDAAKRRCDENPRTRHGETLFDSHRIEEWEIGAERAAYEWIRRDRDGDEYDGKWLDGKPF